LHRFEANFFRKQFAKFRKYLQSFIEDVTKKHFGLLFPGHSVHIMRVLNNYWYLRAIIKKQKDISTHLTSLYFSLTACCGSVGILATMTTRSLRHCCRSCMEYCVDCCSCDDYTHIQQKNISISYQHLSPYIVYCIHTDLYMITPHTI